MKKLEKIQNIKQIYAKGGNLLQYLRQLNYSGHNSSVDIMISYDFQSGSYIRNFFNNSRFYENYSQTLADLIKNLVSKGTILEAGVGEAVIFKGLIDNLDKTDYKFKGFDISWSRLKFGKEFLADFRINEVELFTGDIFEIPLPDNSVEMVFTSHAIEPNGGREEAALKELYRVSSKYLILLEPSFQFAGKVAKLRMRKHGYVTNLYKTAKDLGYNVIEHRLFDHCYNPLNPTGLLIIEKKSAAQNFPSLVCPITKTSLMPHNTLLYSEEGLMAYPIIDGIPCLLKENAILTTHLKTNYQEFKLLNNINWNKL